MFDLGSEAVEAAARERDEAFENGRQYQAIIEERHRLKELSA